MSGESASGVVLEVCTAAAAGTLVAARAVAGVTRTTLTAPGAGLSSVGRWMEHGYTRHQERETELAAWEAAAREVVDRNARISVLAARPGGAPGLPQPLVLGGQNRAELTAWCARVDEALQRAERALLAEAASAVSVALASVTAPTNAADVLADHEAAPTAPPFELVEACRRILGGLTAEVAAAQRAEVLAAVGRVRDCKTPAARQGWLAELRVRVRQANARAAQRRVKARTAATMLQALAGATAPQIEQLRRALEGVVAGRRELDPELHQEALAACEQVRLEQEKSYLRDSLTQALQRLGYEVDQGFDTYTGHGTRLRLVRDQWPEHAVSMLLDNAEVRAMVVRTRSGEGDDATRLDIEREQQWCADFDQLREKLAGDGLRLDVQRLIAPGERHVPVAARRRPPATLGENERRENKLERGR